MKPIPDGLAFTCDKAFSLFSPLFLANLYICFSFPPSVKVSTQCTAVFCLWKHSWMHPSGNLYLEEWWGQKAEWSDKNIKHLPTIANNCCIFPPFISHHPLLIKHPLLHITPIFSSISMALIGYSKSGRARRANRFAPIKPSSGWSFANLDDVFKALLRKQRANTDKHLGVCFVR